MKKILILTLLLISCKHNQKESFIINGKIKGDIPEYIFLYSENKKDSSFIENGKFHFKGKVNKPVAAYFHINNHSTMVNDLFYLENKSIQIEISNQKKKINGIILNFIKTDTISGSPTEVLRQNFETFESENNKDLDWNLKLFSKLDNIISKNPRNDFSINQLLYQINKGDLNSNQINHLYKKIDTLEMSIVQLETIRQAIHPEQILKIGNHLYDFELPNSDKKNINTADFRGKILLIDFWASWCSPCRKMNPELLDIYKEFKEFDFEILGVSLDSDIKKWNKAIIKDTLIWKNVVDIQAFDGKISAKYNISEIPTNYLIDENGVILDKNISIDDLRIFLKR